MIWRGKSSGNSSRAISGPSPPTLNSPLYPPSFRLLSILKCVSTSRSGR
nr:MAG TPA_asm: hypothetical protein [Caudoviricetes sp.]